MARIQYTVYRFDTPNPITIDDYKILKDIFNEKPGLNINPPSNFVETFKVELIILGFGSVGLFIVSLDYTEWLNWVGGIPALFAFMSLLSFIPSVITYLDFLSDKFWYYRKLKRDIIKSNNYDEFTNLRKKR